MKLKPFAGKLKVWQQRLSTYVSMVNFVMILYLFIIENNWIEWYYWVVLSFLGITSLVFIDTKYIMPSSFAYTFKKNPEFQALRKEVKEVKRLLEELKNE